MLEGISLARIVTAKHTNKDFSEKKALFISNKRKDSNRAMEDK